MSASMHNKLAVLRTCPICSKEYDSHWKVVGHIRRTKDELHKKLIEEQEAEVFKVYMANTGPRFDIYNILGNSKNIFGGIAFVYILRIISKHLSKEELEQMRKDRISRTMKTTIKTAEHNKNVSTAIKKAWKDGKFTTDEVKECRRKGYEKRRSYNGSGNPMYGKPCPRGAGRGRGGIRKDIGHYVRSSWEANIARVCLLLNRKYEYEPKRFYVDANGVSFSYCPDFYFPAKNIYYEIKGHARASDKWVCTCKSCLEKREIMKEVIKKYGIKIVIIGKYEYNKFVRRFCKKIENWETIK